MALTTIKLTRLQIDVLKRLRDLHYRFPDNSRGFEATSLGRRAAEVCRRALGPAGQVRLERTTNQQFRYSLTDAGHSSIAAVENGLFDTPGWRRHQNAGPLTTKWQDPPMI